MITLPKLYNIFMLQRMLFVALQFVAIKIGSVNGIQIADIVSVLVAEVKNWWVVFGDSWVVDRDVVWG